MKAALIICTLFAATLSCTAQNKKRMHYPKVSEALERIDTNIFEEDQFSRKVKIPDGSELHYVKSDAGYSLRSYDPKSYFVVVKNYYPNGFIKEKGASFNANACPLGIWHFFTEEKTLQRKTDYDSGYKFDINEVIKFLTKEHIPLRTGVLPSGGVHTEIFKGTKDDIPVWYIHWLAKPDLKEIITLSGANGRVINRRNEKYDNS